MGGALGLAGCGETPTADSSASKEAPAVGDKDGPSAAPPTKGAAADAAVPDQPRGPTPAELWTRRLAEARTLLAADKLDELAELRESWDADESLGAPPEEIATGLAALDKDAAAKRQARVTTERAQRLAEAQTLMDQGKLDESLRAVSDVLARNPTDEQRQTAGGISEEVERRRKARRQLKSWMQMLASEERKNVQTAQTQLLQDPDTAVGMVLEALQGAESGVQTSNYLETLRLLNRPETTTPAMLALLERTDRAALWPDVVRELTATSTRGLGAKLLDIAGKATSAEQRLAVLQILAQADDPPPETLVRLLPVLAEDGPALAGALRAATNAARVHQQSDWIAGRGFDGGLSAADEATLKNLGPRLAKLAAGAADPALAEVAFAAQSLAALLGFVEAQPVTGVKIVRAEAELPESPAAAALDGVWNSIELKSLWRHPPDRKGSILLDLGVDRVVTGVRIWNLNEPAAMLRGWKDVEVFVSTSPAELSPVAAGQVPLAPGVASTPDYGTTIPIPAVRGRYVRLQAKSVWQADGPNGLAEIQILAAP